MRHETNDMGGKAALLFAALVYCTLSVVAYRTLGAPPPPQQSGICLPPPQAWGIPPLLSLVANITLTLLSALWLLVLNRRYNFIPTTSLLCASAMLLMCGANPSLSGALNSSTLLLAANMAALSLLFGQYGHWNVNPAAIFVAGSLFSLGSMVHYSFLFFIVVYACSAALLKTFHLRELMSLLLGVTAPYWLALGTGIIPLSSLHMPVPGTMWQATLPAPEMLWIIISAVLTAFWGLMAALRNSFSLYSSSTATRAFSHALTLPAATCLILMVVDWDNFPVYYMPLCLFTAIQAGYLGAFGKRVAGALLYWSIAAIYVFLAIMSIYNK